MVYLKQNIFVTIAGVTNDLLPINTGFGTTACIRLANEILLSPTYRFLTIVNFTTQCGKNRHTDILNFPA